MRGTTDQSREALLEGFVKWCNDHITGDEKGQAQIFLDRLFQAFGQRGSLDVGGTAEMRIRKATEDGGGTSFADYVWKPIVLIEMKSAGPTSPGTTARRSITGSASSPTARSTSSSATSTSS